MIVVGEEKITQMTAQRELSVEQQRQAFFKQLFGDQFLGKLKSMTDINDYQPEQDLEIALAYYGPGDLYGHHARGFFWHSLQKMIGKRKFWLRWWPEISECSKDTDEVRGVYLRIYFEGGV